MNPDIQHTLLQLFEQVRHDPDTLPVVLVDKWREGSVEWQLLTSFRSMLEQMQQRLHQNTEMEQQLREKEAQYRSIFEASTDGLIIRNLDGFTVEANPAACSMHGYSYEEFLGLHRMDIIPLEYQAMVAEYMQAIRSGHSFRGQAVDLRKDGSTFPVEVRGSTFTYLGKPHSLSVLRDITERVQAEQQLREKEEQYRSIFEASTDGLFIVELEDSRVVDKPTHLIEAMVLRREPVIIDNVWDDTPLADDYRRMVGELLKTSVDQISAWMAVPLTLKDRAIGILTFTAKEPYYFTSRHAALTMAVANQAAVAMENARLYEQAQELAAVQERQRLARELHDSVSQALYGIALGTHTARTLLDRDPSKVAAPLDYVLSLSEAALAEMQALIFELRPESLETEGLVAALSKQGAALHARHSITVQTDLCEEPDLPLTVKQELYRIAQEALHNIVKHARASSVYLRLSRTAKEIVLEMRDDGVGFDPTRAFPGHLGLRSMQERIRNLSGTFQIESVPGQGTCIQVCILVM